MKGPSQRFSTARVLGTLGVLAVVVVACFALAARYGEQPISLAAALGDPSSTDAVIFWSLRVPRALLGAIVGAGLAASGSTLQALLRNPLAEPYILGVSGGAAVGATLSIALGLSSLGAFTAVARISAPSAFAFVGAVAAMALVFSVSRVQGRSSPYAALLAGVVFNAFAAAAITCIKVFSSPERLGEILYWLAGALGYERPSTLAGAALLQACAVGVMWVNAGRLNLLTLGDDDASALGVAVERTRRVLLLATSLSVAGAVAVSGLIGFVGLIVPHVLRLWLGPDQRLLVPACALAGAAFLMVADLGARLAFSALAAEPPVGVVTALFGGPFFLFLLRRSERDLVS